MSVSPREPALTAEERTIVASQLGREPRDVSGVAARCPFACPAVIETLPVLSDGTPNPTLLYLTCPVLVTAVSTVEARGGVRALKAAFGADESVREVLLEVTRLYRVRRAALAGPGCPDAPARVAAPRGREEPGVGGPSDPSKASCLHAYTAALLAVRQGWLPSVPGAEDVWNRLGLPGAAVWCRDGRCLKLLHDSSGLPGAARRRRGKAGATKRAG